MINAEQAYYYGECDFEKKRYELAIRNFSKACEALRNY